MAAISTCAIELLLQIYAQLHNIDDALHLARCSKQLYAIFDTYRLEIMKDIILSSDIHTYDIKLCHFQDAFQTFASEHLRSHLPAPAALHPSSALFDECLEATTLSDGQVWDIVARWQGVRPLQQLYSHPTIYSKYTAQQCRTGHNPLCAMETLDIIAVAQHREEPDSDCQMSTSTTFSSSDTGRFYRALTAYWVATESRKLAEQCSFLLQSAENTTYDKVWAIWSQRSNLHESLDVLEVFDFVYGFLCRHIDGMNVDSFSDWVEESWWDEPSQHGKWEFFIKNAWLALSPVDIIELLTFTSLWNQRTSGPLETWSREKKRDFMRMRGFFTAGFPGRVMVRDVGESPDAWYSSSDLELACQLQLQILFPDNPSEASAAWTTYRARFWQTNVRGQFPQMSSKRLIEMVISQMEQ